jgi:hypothetical protein
MGIQAFVLIPKHQECGSVQIEAMEGDRVERAFVHVDYIQRELPEHKVERSLLVDDLRRRGPKNNGEALESVIAMSDIPRQHLVTAV